MSGPEQAWSADVARLIAVLPTRREVLRLRLVAQLSVGFAPDAVSLAQTRALRTFRQDLIVARADEAGGRGDRGDPST